MLYGYYTPTMDFGFIISLMFEDV